jgi:hypothetical protein
VVTISESTFSDNFARFSQGGAVYSVDSAVTVTRSAFTGNGAIDGGAIWSGNTLSLSNSTLSDNEASNNGAGLQLGTATATATINSVTMTLNTADSDASGLGDGGGVSVFAGAQATISNSIIAANFDFSSGASTATPKVLDISGTVIDGGHNLIGSIDGSTGIVNGVKSNLAGTNANLVNPRLGPLTGSSFHPLLSGSPAIDRAGPTATPVDQRNIAAVGTRDIGAYELESIVPISGVELRDFDRDGKDDLLERDQVTGANRIRLSSTNFTTETTLPDVNLNWVILNIADYDKDGNLDLLWRNEFERDEQTPGRLVIWRLDNVGSFIAPISLPNVNTTWNVIDTGDFNRDGFIDFLWYNEIERKVTTWQMNGTALGQANTPFNVDLGLELETISDVDGDGFLDLLFRSVDDGQVVYWRMNGFALTEKLYLPRQPFTWTIAGFDDFDRSGVPDISWRNETTEQVEIWKISGTNSVSITSTFAQSRNWKVVDVIDFTGDGFLDILWRNEEEASVEIWAMNGTTLTAKLALPQVNKEWKIQRVASLTSDRKPDILWRNILDGSTTFWQLNDGVFMSAAAPLSSTKSWKLI